MLISAQDVENYKVIKSELDKLRMMVEKSELWVEKKGSSKGEDRQEGEKKEKKEVKPDNQSREHKMHPQCVFKVRVVSMDWASL